MAERRPTRDQRVLLGLLTGGALNTRELMVRRGHWASYDGTHASLARLEKRGHVERLPRSDGVAVWALTEKGRAHADG